MFFRPLNHCTFSVYMEDKNIYEETLEAFDDRNKEIIEGWHWCCLRFVVYLLGKFLRVARHIAFSLHDF